MDGQPRDGQPDVGADEASTAPGTRRPLTRLDVGPPQQLLTGIVKENRSAVGPVPALRLFPNYPNPFNPTTAISYQLLANSFVMLRVYDALGREVATLVDGELGPGTHQAMFDASALTTGTYFVELRSNGYRAVQKMVYAK
jgi:hypothetical protein